MKQRIKLQNKKTIALSVLVAASTGIAIRESYVPYPDMQKNPMYNQTQFKQAVGDIYLRDVPRTYGRPMTVWIEGMSTYGHVGPKAYSYSEERKQSIQQILQNIRTIRSEIRTKAEVWQKNKDTKITAITPAQKTALHAEKLLTNIANAFNA